MLNVDAHNDAIKKERKMTLEQYTRNLRGICKDGSNPDPRLLGGCFERVARYEWQVEERAHMAHISAGWLYKSSRKMVGAAPRRLYSVLSTRALYFYREEADAEPVAYIRLEGLVCRHAIGKSGPKTFELRAASVDGKESETRMIKLKDTGDGPKAEMSKHSSFTFSCETERDAQRWAAAVRDYTVDDEAPAPPAEGGAAPSSVDGSGRSRNVSVDSRAASFRTASPVNVGPEEEDRSRGDSAVGLYHSRERRLSLSRGRFEKKDALKMLERKYEGVNQRTNATPAAGGRAHSASVGSNGSGGGGAGGGGGGGGVGGAAAEEDQVELVRMRLEEQRKEMERMREEVAAQAAAQASAEAQLAKASAELSDAEAKKSEAGAKVDASIDGAKADMAVQLEKERVMHEKRKGLVEDFKQKGNLAMKRGDLVAARTFYSEALEVPEVPEQVCARHPNMCVTLNGEMHTVLYVKRHAALNVEVRHALRPEWGGAPPYWRSCGSRCTPPSTPIMHHWQHGHGHGHGHARRCLAAKRTHHDMCEPLRPTLLCASCCAPPWCRGRCARRCSATAPRACSR